MSEEEDRDGTSIRSKTRTPDDLDNSIVSLLLNGRDPSARRIAILLAVFLHLFLMAITIPVAQQPPPPGVPEIESRVHHPVFPKPPERVPPERPRAESLAGRLVPVPDEGREVWEPVSEPFSAAPLPEGDPGVWDELVGAGEAPPSRNDILFPGVGNATNPEKIHHVEPAFPEMARIAGWEGRVVLRAVIRIDGTVGELQVLQSSGARFGFDRAAADAVKQWRYRPALQHGNPVEVTLTVVVNFTLED